MTPIEAIQGHLKHLDDSLAKLAEADSGRADLGRKVDELAEKIVDLSGAFDRIEGLLGNFIRETELLRASSSQLQSEVRARLKSIGR